MKTPEQWEKPYTKIADAIKNCGLFGVALEMIHTEAFHKFVVAIQQNAISSLSATLLDEEVSRIAEKHFNSHSLQWSCVQAITEALSLVRKNEDTEMLDWLDDQSLQTIMKSDLLCKGNIRQGIQAAMKSDKKD